MIASRFFLSRKSSSVNALFARTCQNLLWEKSLEYTEGEMSGTIGDQYKWKRSQQQDKKRPEISHRRYSLFTIYSPLRNTQINNKNPLHRPYSSEALTYQCRSKLSYIRAIGELLIANKFSHQSRTYHYYEYTIPCPPRRKPTKRRRRSILRIVLPGKTRDKYRD